VKLANKTQSAATYVLTVAGLNGARVSLPESAPGLAPDAIFNVLPSQVGNFRLMVQGMPDASGGGSQNIYVTLKIANTGEILRYRALFLSPAPEKD
jgi:hypothetical protein